MICYGKSSSVSAFGLKQARQLVIVPSATISPAGHREVMLFRVSGRGRATAPAGRQRRRRMAVARLGDAGDAGAAPRRGGRLFALVRIGIVLPRLRLRALLLRSQRALARLRNYYADVMKGLIADAAAAEPAKARRVVEARAGTGERTLVHAGRPAAVVVPAAVAGAVLRCNSHYYVR